MKKYTLKLKIPDQVKTILERMQVLSRSLNLADTIGAAVCVYDELLRSVEEGGEIIIRDKEGQDTRLKIIRPFKFDVPDFMPEDWS